MAVHTVSLNLKKNTVEVENTDIEVVVKTDGEKLGTVLISRGNIEWKPKRKSQTRYQLSWQQFDTLMKEQRKVKKTKRGSAKK